jgi:hypothetical protein
MDTNSIENAWVKENASDDFYLFFRTVTDSEWKQASLYSWEEYVSAERAAIQQSLIHFKCLYKLVKCGETIAMFAKGKKL